jgi:hypothetical protein
MARRLKLIASLSSLAIGAVALSACGGEGEGAEGGAEGSAHGSAHAEGEGESEGASAPAAAPTGGEAEGAALAGLGSDKAAYVAALILARGHLAAGAELYAKGAREEALAHLQHPQAEIMTSLAPALETYGAADLMPSLQSLAEAGAANAGAGDFETKRLAAFGAIASAEKAAAPTVKERLLGVARALTVAGEEYAIGVKDGVVVNAHEYHDAYGFLVVAEQALAEMKGVDAGEQGAIDAAREQVRLARAVAPSIAAPQALPSASGIFGAAARIEIAANGL